MDTFEKIGYTLLGLLALKDAPIHLKKRRPWVIPEMSFVNSQHT